MAEAALLDVAGLAVSYDGARALDGVSLRVREGEFVAVIGANGAGKTTLVKTVMGLLRPDAGAVRFAGEEISGRPPYQIVARGIAVVPEGRRLFPELSVRENLELGAYIPRARAGSRGRLDGVLSLFPELAGRLAQPAGLLSGGEQMMVAIGRALMSEPRLLVLDEPSLGLAPKTVAGVMAALRRLKDQGRSALLVEQNVLQALRIGDRAYALENGRVVLEGSDLLERPEVKRAYLGI